MIINVLLTTVGYTVIEVFSRSQIVVRNNIPCYCRCACCRRVCLRSTPYPRLSPQGDHDVYANPYLYILCRYAVERNDTTHWRLWVLWPYATLRALAELG